MAEARGVILLAAQKAGVQVYEYTPNEVKIAVTGYGRALKPQVMEMTRRLLVLPAVPKPDDTAERAGYGDLPRPGNRFRPAPGDAS